MAKYLDMQIKRLYESEERKLVYSQSEVSKILEVPAVFVRMLLDAGRLDYEHDRNARMVAKDSTKWYDAKRSWKTALKEYREMKHRKFYHEHRDKDKERTARWIEGMKHRQEREDKLHREYYERMM